MATCGYSNFTDSYSHSQSMSQDMSLSSQQSSQEGSDPKLGNTYHIKPLLFGEFKDKSKGLGILDKFEDDKQTARDKADRDMLAKECCRFRETLNSVSEGSNFVTFYLTCFSFLNVMLHFLFQIQHLVAGIERNTAVCQTANEKLDGFASAIQNNLTRLQSDISQQFETLLSKLNSQKEMMTELESRIQKSGEAATELDSHLESLRNSLESLKEEKESERNMADKVLKLLSTFVSEHSVKPSHEGVMDHTSKLGGSQADESQNLQNNQVEVPYQGPSFISRKRKPTLRCRKRHKKRPLVLSQRSRHPVLDENRKPVMISRKQQNVSKPLCERQNLSQSSLSSDCPAAPSGRVRSIAAGCFITPLSCWSQDSSSPLCLPGMEPILDKLSTESRTGTPVKDQSLWQLFDMNDSVFGL
ncbi:uncharacterized protein V6R79_015028 [Siganus canaliculatus]